MPCAPNIALLIMAAGRSSRMGQDKLLLRLKNGETMLEDRLKQAIKSSYPVFVALPEHNLERLTIVQSQPVTALICPGAHLGIGHSLAQAVSQLPKNLDAIMILLADMPEINSADIRQICHAYCPNTVVRGAFARGETGHPVLIPATLRPKLEMLQGDRGAHAALKGFPTRICALPGQHAICDIDTPNDWENWRATSTEN